MASRPRVFGSQNRTNQDHDAQRRTAFAWRKWYGLAAWRKRRDDQLGREPFCRFCEQRDIVTPASVADHVIPHRGDFDLFWSGELQSLCATCHSSTKQALERRPQHPRGGVNR